MLDLNYALTLVFGGLLILALVIISNDRDKAARKAFDAFSKLIKFFKYYEH